MPFDYKTTLTRAAAILLMSVFALPVFAADPAADDAIAMKRFVDALVIMQDNNADPVDMDQAFYGGAVPGLLRHLDPHSSFFDPGQFEQLNQMQRSTSKGFGTVVSILPGRVMVLQTLPNTPSSRAGMMPGDEIRAVNNYRLDRLEPDQIIELLTESRQKPVDLVVRHPGALRLDELRLVPEQMQAPSVERFFMLQSGVAYIRVAAFEESTGRDIQAAIEKLGGKNLTGLVLDLRNNPGGLVTAALQTATLFLKPGKVILTAHGRNVPETIERVPMDNVPYTFPVSVLINAKTASASEIVTGALQDHDRATVVGEPSFGKGLVQSVYPLSENTGLALTTALYYTASGRSIQKPFHEEGLNWAPPRRIPTTMPTSRPTTAGPFRVAAALRRTSWCSRPGSRSFRACSKPVRRLPRSRLSTSAITKSPKAGRCRSRRWISFSCGLASGRSSLDCASGWRLANSSNRGSERISTISRWAWRRAMKFRRRGIHRCGRRWIRC